MYRFILYAQGMINVFDYIIFFLEAVIQTLILFVCQLTCLLSMHMEVRITLVGSPDHAGDGHSVCSNPIKGIEQFIIDCTLGYTAFTAAESSDVPCLQDLTQA